MAKFMDMTPQQVAEHNQKLMGKHGKVTLEFVFSDGYRVRPNEDEELGAPFDCLYAEFVTDVLEEYALSYVMAKVSGSEKVTISNEEMEAIMNEVSDDEFDETSSEG